MKLPDTPGAAYEEFFDDVLESKGQPTKKSYLLQFDTSDSAEMVKKSLLGFGVECFINPMLNDSKTVYVPRKEVQRVSMMDSFPVFDDPFDRKITLR